MRTEIWVDASRRPWQILVPTSRRERARGLLGRSPLGPRNGLLLAGCRSVHTVGMSFRIDAALLDERWRVIAVVSLPPWRVLRPRRGVRHVLEVSIGSGLEVGDRFSPGGRAR